MRTFLAMPNYRDNLLALGYEADDVGAAGSERLFDDLIAWGPADRVRERIQQHIDAGADHVQVEVVADTFNELVKGYRALVPILT